LTIEQETIGRDSTVDGRLRMLASYKTLILRHMGGGYLMCSAAHKCIRILARHTPDPRNPRPTQYRSGQPV